MILNQNTVRQTPRIDGSYVYEVLDSFGRLQGTHETMNAALDHVGGICRFGWPLELSEHSTSGACHAEHDQYAEYARLNGHRAETVRIGL